MILSLLILVALPSGHDAVGQVETARQTGYREATNCPEYVVPGVVVVKLERSGSLIKAAPLPNADAALQAFARYGVTSVNRAFPRRVPLSHAAVASGKVDLSQIYFVAIPAGRNPIEVATELARLPGVEYAEPKYRNHPCVVPNDSDYVPMQQGYFDRMRVAEGWTLQKGSADVVIATVDGGTNWEHPDLTQNLWINPLEDINHSGSFEPVAPPAGDLNDVDDDGNGKVDDVIGWNFSRKSWNVRGTNESLAIHGTETASVFGAVTDNGRGMAGTSWNCRLMPLCGQDSVDDYCYQAIVYASEMGARVINCSWFRAGGPLTYQDWEQEIITAATEQGSLIVAAAQNDGTNLDIEPHYPASYDHVLAVGATMASSDQIAHFTNFGLSVSVFAPGVGIYAASDDGSYRTDTGTSLSSPLVAGLAGLLFARHPDWTPDMVAEQIRMTADPIDAVNPDRAGLLGHGRVNFYRALSEVHPGVVVTAGRFQTPSGRTFYVEGDTVIFSVKLKNVLTLAAENLTFNVAANPVLVPLGPPHAPTRLGAGTEDSLVYRFRVGSLSYKGDVQVRLGWSSNGGESDARVFKITLYPGRGYWEYQRSPTSFKLYDVHAVSGRVVWAVGNDYYSSRKTVVLRTTDGGENWVCVLDRIVDGSVPGFPQLTAAPICISAVDSLHAWIAGGEWGMIFATTDGGVSWTQQSYPPPESYLLKRIRFIDALNGYAWGEPYGSGKYVIVRTTDGGATWSHIANEPFAVKETWQARAFYCTDMQHIWLGTPDSLVWRTTDGGSTWKSTSVGKAAVTALAMRDDSVGVACSGWDGPPSFSRTTDGGATWHELTNVKPIGGFAIGFPSGPCAWIGGGTEVTCSRDNGLTWELEPTNPISQSITGLSFTDSEHGWMVTDGGQILRYQDRSTTSNHVDRDRVLPAGFLLEQNYPNPFNPTTKLRYSVGRVVAPSGASPRGVEGPAVNRVRLVVYDLLGRQVASLVDEVKAPGSYQVNFDGSRLASGIYVYRLTVGSFVQARKMILIR